MRQALDVTHCDILFIVSAHSLKERRQGHAYHHLMVEFIVTIVERIGSHISSLS
jgi:hypothetical protein